MTNIIGILIPFFVAVSGPSSQSIPDFSSLKSPIENRHVESVTPEVNVYVPSFAPGAYDRVLVRVMYENGESSRTAIFQQPYTGSTISLIPDKVSSNRIVLNTDDLVCIYVVCQRVLIESDGGEFIMSLPPYIIVKNNSKTSSGREFDQTEELEIVIED